MIFFGGESPLVEGVRGSRESPGGGGVRFRDPPGEGSENCSELPGGGSESCRDMQRAP